MITKKLCYGSLAREKIVLERKKILSGFFFVFSEQN